MKDYMRINPSIKPVTSHIPSQNVRSHHKSHGFGDILKEKLTTEDIKISAHAKMRMSKRNIKLSNDDIRALENAVEKAEQKGVRSSLVLMRDNAFVVSIKNKTIITAIDGESIRENVFTNIDGAVIV